VFVCVYMHVFVCNILLRLCLIRATQVRVAKRVCVCVFVCVCVCARVSVCVRACVSAYACIRVRALVLLPLIPALSICAGSLYKLRFSALLIDSHPRVEWKRCACPGRSSPRISLRFLVISILLSIHLSINGLAMHVCRLAVSTSQYAPPHIFQPCVSAL